MTIFKKYSRLLSPPKKCKKLYMRLRVKFTPNIRFCDKLYGCNKISTMVKTLCKDAGFEGKYTNHSLRATSASRMFNACVPEQIIKEVTGHKSDCVRVYKRTSDDIRKNASETVSGIVEQKFEAKHAIEPVATACKLEKVQSIDESLSQKDKHRLNESMSACQMIKNVIRSRLELKNKTKKLSKNVKKVVSKLIKV